MTTPEVLQDILLRLDRIDHTLSGIGMTLWGPAGNPFTEDALAAAQEVAKKAKEKRDADIKRALDARAIARPGVDPEFWSEDDELASQMY